MQMICLLRSGVEWVNSPTKHKKNPDGENTENVIYQKKKTMLLAKSLLKYPMSLAKHVTRPQRHWTNSAKYAIKILARGLPGAYVLIFFAKCL
jgi:hypothetical protein